MIRYKKIEIDTTIIDEVVCDKCGKHFNDEFELQEFHHINFIGGYSSIFGDEYHITCNICQYCLFDMIKDIYKIIN